MKQEHLIRNQDELDALLGTPKEIIKQKVVKRLDRSMENFIERSPLLFISTCDSNGLVDISPKGDAPGFVAVDQSGALLIPERPGNKLMFGFRNILSNNHVGLIFVIPGTRETLRVKGVATLTKDPEIIEALSDKEKPALLCTYVDVKECFFHCGKAMIRSQLWTPESWGQDEQLMVKHFSKKHQIDGDQIKSDLEKSYRANLY